jgi:hypothetical protein
LAIALVSAMRSWLVRESLVSLRPYSAIGRITAGITSAVRPARRGLVQTISAAAPITITTLRSATEMLEPISVCTTSVSVPRREISSPTRVFS